MSVYLTPHIDRLADALRQAVAEGEHSTTCKAVARHRPNACDCWLGDAVLMLAEWDGSEDPR